MWFVVVFPPLVSTTTPQSVCPYAFLNPCTHINVQVCLLNIHTDLNILLLSLPPPAISVLPCPCNMLYCHLFLPATVGGGKCHMLSDHGSVMLHSAACSFYNILILSYLLLASVFWTAPDFLIITCLVAQLVAFHSSHVYLFSVFLCLLPSFVCISSSSSSSLSLLSLSFSLCPSQSFPLSNIKCPPLPSTQTLLPSTDITELAHCHPPTSAWHPPLLPPPPPCLPLRRRRREPLGTRPSSPPSSPPRSHQPFPQSRQE